MMSVLAPTWVGSTREATSAGSYREEEATLVIVAGWFEVDPKERDAFVAERVASIHRSRSEPGCIEYVIAADPADPARAVLFERWASEADLDAHLGRSGQTSTDSPSVSPTGMSIVVYDISGERALA